GHGTHVAGTIAAVNNNGIGVCGVAGGSGAGDGVKIMSVQIFSGSYGVSYANEVRAVKYAADNGAVILQCSWGYNSALADPLYYSRGYGSDEEFETRSPLEKEAFDYFIYHAGSRNGVIDGGVVVFASGNENAAMAAYPGAYKDYICVSALAGDYTPSTYSNYGPGVDICAPGGDTDYHCSTKGGILSTLPAHVSDGQMYGYMEGTSMSCPHISGFVALGLSYAAKLHKHYDSREFRDIVLKSVRDVNPYLNGEKLYHLMWGTIGDTCPTIVDLKKTYYGKMGAGVADADLLLKNIEGSGTPIRLANMYVATGTEAVQDLFHCFPGASKFTAVSSDTSVAEVSVSGTVLKVKGVKAGTSRLTVTPDSGSAQTVVITVRNEASEGGGWL
ncbi:MAG: S8 family serine peptidase, partial [Candidatus Cryptobacteroides sp.]